MTSDGNVLSFSPNQQALENIPHMLRYWADTIERDTKAGTELELALLVLVQKGSSNPAFCVLGTPHDQPPHPLFVAGVFDACRFKMQVAAEDSDDA